MTNEKILIITGHGQNDVGAIGNGENERDSVLPYGTSIYNKLKQSGFNVGYEWDNGKINSEISLANSGNYNLLISYHRNAYNGNVGGFEVLHYPSSSKGKQLSEFINKRVIEKGYKSRGLKPRSDLGILRQTNGVSIILEIDFIDFKGDEIPVNEMTDIVYNSICEYYNIKSVCKYCGK